MAEMGSSNIWLSRDTEQVAQGSFLIWFLKCLYISEVNMVTNSLSLTRNFSAAITIFN